MDLSVLDVLQVFGRAGRPGFETSGEGYICTTEDKLQHYLDAVTSQVPHCAIVPACSRLTECADSHRVTVCTSSYSKTVTDIHLSRFVKGMTDSMNAEIALGTVTTVQDAVRWLGYTYLFVRMQKSPTLYGALPIRGCSPQMAEKQKGSKRHELVLEAAHRLVEAKMINFDEDSGSFTINDLGRLAAKYYIHHKSIIIFNRELRTRMTEADVLSMVSLSTEVSDSYQNLRNDCITIVV